MNTTDKNKPNHFQGNANTPLLSSQPSSSPNPIPSPSLEKKRLTLKLNINRENLSTRLPINVQTNRLSEAKDQNLTKEEKASNNFSNIKSNDNTSTKEYAANNLKNEVSTEENTAVTSSDKTSKDKSLEDKTSGKDKKTKKDKKPKPPPKPQIVHPKANMKPDEYLATLKTLQKKFPKAFNRKVQLLKIDIHKDILSNSDLNITRIRSFLNLYCNTKRYKKNYVFGRERFDLNGEVTGTYDIVKETKELSAEKDGQELNNPSASQKTEGTKRTDNTKELGELKSQGNKNTYQAPKQNKPQPSSQHNKLQQTSVQSKSQQSFNQNKSQVPYHQKNKNAQNSHQQVKSQSPANPSQQNKLQQPSSHQNKYQQLAQQNKLQQPNSHQNKSQPSQQSYQISPKQNKPQPNLQQNKPQQSVDQNKHELTAQQKKLAKYALLEKEMLGKF